MKKPKATKEELEEQQEFNGTDLSPVDIPTGTPKRNELIRDLHEFYRTRKQKVERIERNFSSIQITQPMAIDLARLRARFKELAYVIWDTCGTGDELNLTLELLEHAFHSAYFACAKGHKPFKLRATPRPTPEVVEVQVQINETPDELRRRAKKLQHRIRYLERKRFKEHLAKLHPSPKKPQPEQLRKFQEERRLLKEALQSLQPKPQPQPQPQPQPPQENERTDTN